LLRLFNEVGKISSGLGNGVLTRIRMGRFRGGYKNKKKVEKKVRAKFRRELFCCKVKKYKYYIYTIIYIFIYIYNNNNNIYLQQIWCHIDKRLIFF
jgi:hypothetical protein